MATRHSLTGTPEVYIFFRWVPTTLARSPLLGSLLHTISEIPPNDRQFGSWDELLAMKCTSSKLSGVPTDIPLDVIPLENECVRVTVCELCAFLRPILCGLGTAFL
jgi:hypothetical protein